jgi:CheY-like chemotaxis protein
MNETASKKCVVLVVEDDEAISDLFSMTLEQEGYDVCVANDGQAGLDLISSRRPAAVLLDLMLPGMDGFAVLRRLREKPETARIPVAVVSAYADAGDTRAILGKEPNVCRILLKPVRVEDLLSQVKLMVEGR